MPKLSYLCMQITINEILASIKDYLLTSKHQLTMKKIVLLMAIAILSLASCNKAVPSLDNQSFTITELNGQALAPNEFKTPSIAFDGTRVNATVGGNEIFAMYAAEEDGTIALTEGGSTKMAVPEELREDEFIAAFNKVARYTFEGEEVCFYDADGKLLFKAVK